MEGIHSVIALSVDVCSVREEERHADGVALLSSYMKGTYSVVSTKRSVCSSREQKRETMRVAILSSQEERGSTTREPLSILVCSVLKE
jgi:hypothetical protein